MILIFSDIHGDKKAAKFIELISKGFSEVIFCGDVCGYGDDFKYCIDMFKARGVKAVRGNHDYAVINNQSLDDIPVWVKKPLLKTRKKIKPKELEYLKALPTQLETEGGIFVTHTFGLENYLHNAYDCKPLLSYTESKIIAIGHTHKPAEHILGDVKVINPGSISFSWAKERPTYAMLDKDRVIMRSVDNWK